MENNARDEPVLEPSATEIDSAEFKILGCGYRWFLSKFIYNLEYLNLPIDWFFDCSVYQPQ